MNDNSQRFTNSEFQKNIQLYEQALQTGESIYMDSDVFLDIVDYYLNEENTQKAFVAIDKALDIFPNNDDLLKAKARLYLITTKDLVKAFQYLERVEDKDDIEFIFLQAEYFIVAGHANRAHNILIEALNEVEEDETVAFLCDATELFCDYDQYKTAKWWFNQVPFSTEIDYRELKVRVLLGNGNLDEGEKILQELLDEEPFSLDYWNNLAAIQLSKNDYAGAVSSCEFALAIDSSNQEALLYITHGYFGLHNYEATLLHINKYLALNPNELGALIFKVQVLLLIDKSEEAVDCLHLAEQVAGNEQENLGVVYQEMAYVFSHLGKLNEALHWISKKENLPNEDPITIFILKGYAYLENNNSNIAMQWFEKALQESNQSPDVIRQIAIAACDCNYLEQAIQLFERYLRIQGNTAETDTYAYLSYCFLKQNKHDKAAHYLQMSCTIDPQAAKNILEELFPNDVEPADYYQYYIQTNNISPTN